MVFALRTAVMATALAAMVLASLGSAQVPLDQDHAESEAISPIEVSLTPGVSVRGGTPTQHGRLEEALARFVSAGLLLPDLEVEFMDGVATCNGHLGLFQAGHAPWRILICDTSVDSVYEHELAHAWELANLTDEIRSDFVAFRGYSTWADRSVPWNDRGIEGVAVIIQQGLAGLPLPPYLSTEHQSRLEAFEMLTDRPAPRLLEWCAAETEHRASQNTTVALSRTTVGGALY